MTPIASVLLPTRNRVELARESLVSLGEGNFEALLWVDNDDPQLSEYWEFAEGADAVRLLVEPRVSYARFHEMINRLAREARGDWLLLWNDDARMEGDWLSELRGRDASVPASMNYTPETQMNLFPAISRGLYEAQGFFSLSVHCDTWIEEITRPLGLETVSTAHVTHVRDELNDSVKSETQAVYSTSSPAHFSPQMNAEKELSRQRVQEVLVR